MCQTSARIISTSTVPKVPSRSSAGPPLDLDATSVATTAGSTSFVDRAMTRRRRLTSTARLSFGVNPNGPFFIFVDPAALFYGGGVEPHHHPAGGFHAYN